MGGVGIHRNKYTAPNLLTELFCSERCIQLNIIYNPMSSTPPPRYTPTVTPPQASGPPSFSWPSSETTPLLLPPVQVPALSPHSRYHSREELRWRTCCRICGLCVIYYIALFGSFVGFLTLLRESVLCIFVWVFYLPVGFIGWFVITQIFVYRARMLELREFGPEEGVVAVRGL